MSKLTFIQHSSFLFESESAYLLFDYVQGAVPALTADKPLYIFASHGHHDHFSEAALSVYEQATRTWILADDIELSDEQRNGRRIYTVSERSQYRIDDIDIMTFHSTDQGVAFLIRLDGRSLFYAGDLNWWHWEGEPEARNEQMKRDYLAELDRIDKETGGRCDLAFLVLDPRQQSAMGWGLKAFVERIDCKTIIPMHLWRRFAEGKQWCQRPEVLSQSWGRHLLQIEGDGQEWINL
ncbi:MAG: MBL fold metallo-hydrolase [Eubacteriales bacterium]|nr:MBL fold metallo-hydrolase [Eubacteriales bacterium]